MPWVRDLLASSLLSHATEATQQAERYHAQDRAGDAEGYEFDAASDRSLANRLGAAALWWVTKDMSLAALDAARDIPVISTEDCPADTGLIGFAHPLPLLDTTETGGFPVRLRDGTQHQLTHAHVDALVWTRHGVDIEVRACVQAHRLPGPLPGHTGPLQPFIAIGGTLPLDFEALDARGRMDGPAGSTRVSPGSPIISLMAMLAATWILAATPTVSDRKQIDKPRHISSQPRDPGPPYDEHVTLIDLRAPRHIATPGDDRGRSGREYRQRWIVRGHWRQQAYGPKKSKRRATWIPSHIKGPEGAPLKTTEHVYVWRR